MSDKNNLMKVRITAPERVKLQGIVSLPESEALRLIRLRVAVVADPSQPVSGNVDYAASLQQAEKMLKDQSVTIDGLKKELDKKTETIKGLEAQIENLTSQLMTPGKKSSKEAKRDQ